MEVQLRSIVTLDTHTNLPLFGGGNGGVFLRTDKNEHNTLRQLWESALALFWTVNMVDFSKDAAGFKRLPDNAKRMFKLTNGYQSLMDGGVVNIYNHLALLTNSPSIALSYQQIAFTESIHATSYSDGLLQVFGHEATEIIDIVFTDQVVRTRLNNEIDITDTMINNPTMRNISMAILATYLLEHIKFPFSFFVSFSINKAYDDAINGFSQLLSRISQEEHEIHVPTNMYMLKMLISQGHISHNDVLEMADTILKQELEWNEYLQQDGPIPGYNIQIGEQFIRYWHNKTLRDVGVPVTKIEPSDTVRWYNHYRDPDNKQVSQQEIRSTQYQKGVIKNDLASFFKDKRNGNT
jgi:ribonucleoside-diphosphate reductase beta chain